MIRPAHSLADLVAGWGNLAPGLSEAELARDVREVRDDRASSR